MSDTVSVSRKTLMTLLVQVEASLGTIERLKKEIKGKE
jgi:hypothetical protein